MHTSFKVNFPRMHYNKNCTLQCKIPHLDSQEQILKCTKLTQNLNLGTVQIMDFYEGIDKQIKVAKVVEKLILKKEKIMKTLEEK